jgi:hypothetical protein
MKSIFHFATESAKESSSSTTGGGGGGVPIVPVSGVGVMESVIVSLLEGSSE